MGRVGDNVLAPDLSEIRLLTRSRPVVGTVLSGTLAVGSVASALFAWSDLFSAHISIVLVFATLGVGFSGATVWLWSQPGAVTSRLTGTRWGLMWGPTGTENSVPFDELSSVKPCRAGLTWSLRFVSDKWHANTLQRCSDFESVLQFVEANWDGEIIIDGQATANVAEAKELRDDDEAPPTKRSEEFHIPAPPESQVRLRESEVEL